MEILLLNTGCLYVLDFGITLLYLRSHSYCQRSSFWEPYTHTRWGVHLASQMGMFNPGYQWGLCHRQEHELNGRDSNRHLIKNSQGASRANPPFPSLPGPEFSPLFLALTLLPHKAQNYFLQLLFSLLVVCFQGSECGLREGRKT